MLADIFLNLPIETVECGTLAPPILTDLMVRGICIAVGAPIVRDGFKPQGSHD